MTDDSAYGHDPATDTVRVMRQDLARLLLQFRAEVERPGRSLPWSHMHDYDTSFERLAPARALQRRHGHRRGRPARRRHGSHYASLDGRGLCRALCGFTFAREEARPIPETRPAPNAFASMRWPAHSQPGSNRPELTS